jgi:hypothetical protein
MARSPRPAAAAPVVSVAAAHLAMILTMILAMVLAAHPAGAAPTRTPEEVAILARNPDLAALAARNDPGWHKVLAAILKARAQPAAGSRSGRPPPTPGTQDLLQRNPDLMPVENASPEALHDLLILIRQAGNGGPKR